MLRTTTGILAILSAWLLLAANKVLAEEHGHEAAHGGCLNELCECENGHAEVKVEGNLLRLWFVGGGNDTKKSVRVPDKELTLTVKGSNGAADKQVVLKAKPIELAEEKVGDCSCFEGQADWLKDVKEFVATGSVMFKGKKTAIRIEYPKGYDPDHDAPVKK
ncbi:MAG: hypothetical protein ABSE73_13810 [Planctomycetota bacterium]